MASIFDPKGKSFSQRINTFLDDAKAGTLDNYLAQFGLYRPLLNHPTSPEKWHVEAKVKSKIILILCHD